MSGVQINWQSAVIVLITWLISALLAYGAVDARVRVLEDRYQRMVTDIGDIKVDVKELLRRKP